MFKIEELIEKSLQEAIVWKKKQDNNIEKICLPKSNHLGVSEEKFFYIDSIILLGSRGDDTAVEYSDYDVLVVTSGLSCGEADAFSGYKIKNDARRLRNLLLEIAAMDPLLHHGYIFLNKRHMGHYDEFYMPLDAIRKGVVEYGENELCFDLCENDVDKAKKRLLGHANWLENGAFDFSSRYLHDYSLKYQISSVLLTPAWLMASVGQYVEKGESFRLYGERFPSISEDLVKRCERMRLDWAAPDVNIFHHVALRFGIVAAHEIFKKMYKKNSVRYKDELNSARQEAKKLSQEIVGIINEMG